MSPMPASARPHQGVMNQTRDGHAEEDEDSTSCANKLHSRLSDSDAAGAALGQWKLASSKESDH